VADKPDPGIDWHGSELPAIIDLYHQRLDRLTAALKTKPPS
jgi:hypothetical protein